MGESSHCGSFRGPVIHPIDDCEHPLLCLPGTGIASQETSVSGSCQQIFSAKCNSGLVVVYGMDPGVGQLANSSGITKNLG
jgi:hypothetical protein